MRITDIIVEDADSSGDYQNMQAFIKANRVGGVPPDQQVALALFKELQKQKQHNQQLDAELDAAEQRIDQATQSGELSKQELGMHRGELDRERKAGEQQKAAIGQLGQQYSEREKASADQMQDLTSQLEQVKNKPGVDAKAAKDLENQIKQLSKNSVSADQVAELEAHIATVQNMQRVDDTAIKDLVAQVNAAQEASKEIEKTKDSLTTAVGKTAQDALDQVAQMKQDLERLRQVETNLEQEFNDLRDSYQETDATLWDIESQTIPAITQNIDQLKTAVGSKPEPAPVPQQPAPPPAKKVPPQAANHPTYTPKQIATAKKLGLSGDLQDPNFQAVAESAFNRSVAWATGKKL